MSFVSHSALISISLDTSLLNVPFSRFPQVLSSPTCPTSQTSTTSTSFCGSRNNPRVSARWSGMSGRTANPTPKHRLWAQLPQLPARGAHADQFPWQFPVPWRRHHHLSGPRYRSSLLGTIQQQQANRSWQSSHHVRIFRCESLETAASVGWQSCEHTSNWYSCG